MFFLLNAIIINRKGVYHVQKSFNRLNGCSNDGIGVIGENN